MKLTEPRKRALAVLLHQEQINPHVKVRSSNATSDDMPRTVYWQVAEWLLAEGLAADAGPYQFELTDEGRKVAKREAKR